MEMKYRIKDDDRAWFGEYVECLREGGKFRLMLWIYKDVYEV
jgi:hypothetical protein